MAWLYRKLNIETDLKYPVEDPFELGEIVPFKQEKVAEFIRADLEETHMKETG